MDFLIAGPLFTTIEMATASFIERLSKEYARPGSSRSEPREMASRRTNLLRDAICVLIAFSVLSTACEVHFESDIEPLIIEEAPDQPFASEIGSADSSLEEFPQEVVGGAELTSELTSSDALALCGAGLSWGDESIGMCLAPGGDAYFAWTSEGTVIRVMADATDINQSIFQQAVRDRASALDEIKTQGRSVIYEAGGFLIALAAAVPACATIFGCAVDGAALMVTGGLLAESGSLIVDNIELGESATKQADYSYCRMIGGSDAECRASAGITDELGGR